MSSFADIQVLIIVSDPKLRAQLRAMIEQFGFGVVHLAINANTALHHLRSRRYELIICDYALGNGQDGQHLLEDLRQHEIIAADTLFVMITGERNYDRVVGAAELLPDDYILTPIVTGALKFRLERLIEKREVFLPAWRAAAIGNWLGAIDYCMTAEVSLPQYLIDFQRLEAGFHIAAGKIDEAQSLYRQILSTLRIPWAQLGLARCLVFRKDYVAADRILSELINEHPNFMAAYDLLARTRTEDKRADDAARVLKTAVDRSPLRLARQRYLGELALEAGDAATAEEAMSEVIRQSANSGFPDPEDHVRLAQALIAQDKTASAKNTIADLDRRLMGHPKAKLCSALANAMLHIHQHDDKSAKAELEKAAKLAGEGEVLSPSLSRELVQGCFEHDLKGPGSKIVTHLLRVSGDERMVVGMREMLAKRGFARLSQKIESELQQEVKALVAAGAEMARANDYDGAVKAMSEAAERMPGHPVVLFNAALALLRHIEHNRWDDELARHARVLIERARNLDPASTRLATLAEYMHMLIERYGALGDPDNEPLLVHRARG